MMTVAKFITRDWDVKNLIRKISLKVKLASYF